MECSIKVSVIIPVYNAEKYLRGTLESIKAQTLQEIEIICVNDGSDDASEAIIREEMRRDDRIRLINQKNSYAGTARNNGLANAVGKYVVFWDADDLFEKDALECLFVQAEKTEAEICVCGGKQLYEPTGHIFPVDVYLNEAHIPQKQPFCREDMQRHIFSFAANVPWNKMYRREFILQHGLQFQNLKQANDTYFVLMAFFFAERIAAVRKRLIIYRTGNEKSLTGKASDTILCAYESYLSTWTELNNYPEFSGEIRKGFSMRFFRGMLHSLNSQSSLEGYRIIYNKVVSEGFGAMEVDQLKKEDFDAEWHCRAYQNMQKMSAEEYLMWDMQRHIRTMERDKATIRQLKKTQSLSLRFVRKAKRIILNCFRKE